MKKFFVALILFFNLNAEIRKLQKDEVETIEKNLILFAQTITGEKETLDISKILNEKNNKLFAKYKMEMWVKIDLKRWDLWFSFDNNDDANKLQSGDVLGRPKIKSFDGKKTINFNIGINVEWYYLPFKLGAE